MTGVLYQKGKSRHRDRHVWRENGVRSREKATTCLSELSTYQSRDTKIAVKHQNLEETRTGSPLEALERA